MIFFEELFNGVETEHFGVPTQMTGILLTLPPLFIYPTSLIQPIYRPSPIPALGNTLEALLQKVWLKLA